MSNSGPAGDTCWQLCDNWEHQGSMGGGQDIAAITDTKLLLYTHLGHVGLCVRAVTGVLFGGNGCAAGAVPAL